MFVKCFCVKMSIKLPLFLFLVLQFVSSSVLRETAIKCGTFEKQCRADGACYSLDKLCDGSPDCVDGSDELDCSPGRSIVAEDNFRTKRQSSCRKLQWRCRDGTCISFGSTCDGAVDCPDQSDESFALCRKTRCENYLFRCTYGACVDLDARCNGVRNCADGSDELHPTCRNGTNSGPRFRCDDGQMIKSTDVCDGVRHCRDGSDETVKSCGHLTCMDFTFQCAYGACVDGGSDCNGKRDCADGSDESDELCNRIGSAPPKPQVPASTSTLPPVVPGNCKLPGYPDHGTYTVANNPGARPGDMLDTAYLNVSCHAGYGLKGPNNIYCFGSNFWSEAMPTCQRQCRLTPHPSVEYRCKVPESDIGTRPCGEFELPGTQVIPRCRAPNYYSPQTLSNMICIEGSWNYVALCYPECGKITPRGTQLVINGTLAERGEIPWHVGIYKTNVKPFKQICGGSIISTTLVISAAHCFWVNGQLLQPKRFAVAAGKIYRRWDEPADPDAQQTMVSDIKITERFAGHLANFQEDIALVFVSVPFVIKVFVRPVCVDFDYDFNNNQLRPGNLGKVAGWGLTAEDGDASMSLRVVDLPAVSIDECKLKSPPDFQEYISGDKICAGYLNGTALCQGDSGGGLAFPTLDKGELRYYLRGIVSTAPKNEAQTSCNSKTYTAFTQLLSHEHFIKKYYSTI